MKNNIIETLVGTAVLVLAAVFIVYGYSVTNVAPQSGYILTASFDRIDGLSIGSDVRMSGIKVGTVIEQKLNTQTYYAEVQLQINDEVKLPDDTSAKITMEGLLGGNYISLTPGGSLDYFENGDELIYTQGSVDLIGLVSQALFSAEESGAE